MTREEAVECLIDLRVQFQVGIFTREAIDMAIEALSAEATTGDYPNDLINRSALMEYCSNQKSKSIDNNDIARFPSAEAVPQSEQYRKGFEDAKRAFELEYARESENMRKRNAQLEVMLNAQKAISAKAIHKPDYSYEADMVRRLKEALSAEVNNRLYIKIYADDKSSVKAEKLYQICDEAQNGEVAKWLKEYFPSAKEDREEYELATEQMEHDAMYEPTYNSEDGSM